jgi:hypothetical protein
MQVHEFDAGDGQISTIGEFNTPARSFTLDALELPSKIR